MGLLSSSPHENLCVFQYILPIPHPSQSPESENQFLQWSPSDFAHIPLSHHSFQLMLLLFVFYISLLHKYNM